MRIVFAGTPEVAVPSLHALVAAGHEVAAVITREDAPLGRKRVLTPSPVAAAAETLGLPMIKSNSLGDDVTQRVQQLNVDLGVIVAFGALVREPLLSAPRLGWINLHFSLLPRWRGAAPVQHALMAGDAETGAGVFQLVAELDAGAIYGELTTPIEAGETSGSLLTRLGESSPKLLVDVVRQLDDGTATGRIQTGEITLAPKPTIDDARVRWNQPADRIDAIIRGVTPEPGAFTTVNDVRVKILKARAVPEVELGEPGRIERVDGSILVGCGSGALRLDRVQPAGKKPMDAADWWRGHNGEVTAR